MNIVRKEKRNRIEIIIRGVRRCDVIINIFEEATRVGVCEAQCGACGAQLVSVEYRPERTRLPAALTDMTACLYCEPSFSVLVHPPHYLSLSLPFHLRAVLPQWTVDYCAGGRVFKPRAVQSFVCFLGIIISVLPFGKI
jgi:hypothetical protein